MQTLERCDTEDNFTPEDLISELGDKEREIMLDCVEKIAQVFHTKHHGPFSTSEIARHLIPLEKSIGHHSVQPLFASIGISVTPDHTSLTNKPAALERSIDKLKRRIEQYRVD